MIIGSLALQKVLWFYIPIMFLTPCLTYYIAVTYKQQPPFPHTTITNTSCHYPQDIIVRLILISGSTFLTFFFYAVNRWLDSKAKQIGFYGFSKSLYYMAHISVLCYCIALSTIDGKGYGLAHIMSAIIFFIIWFAMMINMTVYITKMYNWDTSIMSYRSLVLKQIITVYIVVIWIICLIGLISEYQQNGQDIYVVTVEWNSFFGFLLWLLSFVCEWKFFRIALIKK